MHHPHQRWVTNAALGNGAGTSQVAGRRGSRMSRANAKVWVKKQRRSCCGTSDGAPPGTRAAAAASAGVSSLNPSVEAQAAGHDNDSADRSGGLESGGGVVMSPSRVAGARGRMHATRGGSPCCLVAQGQTTDVRCLTCRGFEQTLPDANLGRIEFACPPQARTWRKGHSLDDRVHAFAAHQMTFSTKAGLALTPFPLDVQP